MLGELRAWHLFAQAQRAIDWLPPRLYPAGGAAGPLLTYLLLRSLDELPIRAVLELGAGLSTRILNAWAPGHGGRVVTFEHDPAWVDTLAPLSSESCQLVHLPLVPGEQIQGTTTRWYQEPPSSFIPPQGFDLVLVDGPPGTIRWSRYGIVSRLGKWTAREWLVLWDDLERPADLESFAALIDRLRADGIDHEHVLFDGDRTVGIVYTPSFRAARYFL